MTKRTGDDTVNAGPAAKPTQDQRDAKYDDITGNVAVRGEKPSPSERERGETTSRDAGGALDANR